MAGNDPVSMYYTALKDARAMISDIDNGATFTRTANGGSQDLTVRIRAHQQMVVDILSELAPDKERRKSPRES